MALLDSFSQFLGSPGAMGLAQGLLQGSQPSMTQPSSFGGALGLGFQHANKAREDEEKRKLAREVFAIQKGTFDLEKAKAVREIQQQNDTRIALGLPPLPMPNIGGQTIANPANIDITGAADQVVGQAMGESPNPEPGVSNTQRQAAYSVRDARINGGAESYIPSHDESGNHLNKEEAIEKAAQNPSIAISKEQPITGGGLISEQPNQEQTGGLLGGLSPEKAEYAKKAYLLGGNAGLLKAIKPETPERRTREEKLLEKGLPTTSTITDNQKVVQAIDNVLPKIEELATTQDVPYQNPVYLGGLSAARLFSPQRMADYEAKVASVTDTLVSALNLPKTNESLHLVSQMISKQPNEGDDAYKSRLNSLIEDLEVRRSNAEAIAPRVGNPAPKRKDTKSKPASSYSDAELQAIINAGK